MDDGDPHLVREVVGIGEVRLERQAEQHDPVRDDRPVGAPFGPRDALVEPVEGVVVLHVVAVELVARGLVLDDDGDLVEGCCERHRDGRQCLVDEILEPPMTGGCRATVAAGA